MNLTMGAQQALSEERVGMALPRGGFLFQYVRHGFKSCDAHIALHVLGGLSLLTQTIPYNWALPVGSNKPNLYGLGVARSGESRKTEAVKIARGVAELAFPGSLGEAPGSAEGLVESLRERSQQLVCSRPRPVAVEPGLLPIPAVSVT